MSGNILLCDDLSDTGVTLNRSIDWLQKYPPLKGKLNQLKQLYCGKSRLNF